MANTPSQEPYSQLVRQWKLLLALDATSQGLTFEEMARMVGVTERTVMRDVDVLTFAGFPIDVQTPGVGRRRTDRARVTLDRSAWRGGAGTIFKPSAAVTH